MSRLFGVLGVLMLASCFSAWGDVVITCPDPAQQVDGKPLISCDSKGCVSNLSNWQVMSYSGFGGSSNTFTFGGAEGYDSIVEAHDHPSICNYYGTGNLQVSLINPHSLKAACTTSPGANWEAWPGEDHHFTCPSRNIQQCPLC